MFAVTERLWVLYTVACRVNHWCSFCFCFVFLFLFLQSSRSVLFCSETEPVKSPFRATGTAETSSVLFNHLCLTQTGSNDFQQRELLVQFFHDPTCRDWVVRVTVCGVGCAAPPMASVLKHRGLCVELQSVFTPNNRSDRQSERQRGGPARLCAAGQTLPSGSRFTVESSSSWWLWPLPYSSGREEVCVCVCIVR